MIGKRAVVVGAMLLALVLVAGAGRPAGPADSDPAESPGDPIGGYVELVGALRGAGATVEPGGTAEQAFFSVAGRIIKVNGLDVQVFEYADETARQADSAQISPDGAIGTMLILWIDQPNFFARGRLIVLYLGTDGGTLDLLRNALGEAISMSA